MLTGENVWLEYDLKDVASEPTDVEVVTPQGKVIKATFDLKKLRSQALVPKDLHMGHLSGRSGLPGLPIFWTPLTNGLTG